MEQHSRNFLQDIIKETVNLDNMRCIQNRRISVFSGTFEFEFKGELRIEPIRV